MRPRRDDVCEARCGGGPGQRASMNGHKVVYEVSVRRENGDSDVLHLCLPCLAGTSDFLRVVRKKKTASDVCDRCG